MSEALRFKIENGVFGLALVDTAASGYSDSWQAPGGAAVDEVTLADYVQGASSWSCQIQTATIDASANANDETVDATWCEPSKVIPNPGETSFAINGTFIQDIHADDGGLWAFLYANDTAEAYFYMGINGDAAPPAAIGRVRVIAASFGGAGRTTLTGTFNALPLVRRYDAWVGQSAPGVIVPGYPAEGAVAATGATAGTPGTWTPPGSTPPASVSALQAAGCTASPNSAWTTGQYVQTGTAGASGEAYWSGSAWTSGRAA